MGGWEWTGYGRVNPRADDREMDEPLPDRPRSMPVHRNGMPAPVPYCWRLGEAEREAEVAAKVAELRAEAARHMAAVDALLT